MFKKIHIRKHERGLWFRKGDFHRLLMPGSYFIWRGRVEIVDTLKVQFTHPLLEQLVREEELKSALLLVDLTDTERALVWKDARLFAILGPGRGWQTAAHPSRPAPAPCRSDRRSAARSSFLLHA